MQQARRRIVLQVRGVRRRRPRQGPGRRSTQASRVSRRTASIAAALARVKTEAEVQLLSTRSDSVLGQGRAARALRPLRRRRPDFARHRPRRGPRAVTADDVMRVYRHYIKGRPHVATSFVPKGKAALALAGSTRAKVVEEAIVQGAEAAVDASAGGRNTRARRPASTAPSSRPMAPRRAVVVPAIWNASLANGLALSRASATASCRWRNSSCRSTAAGCWTILAKPGVAAMTARMLTRGTARRTPGRAGERAEVAWRRGRASVAEDERFLLRGSTLARNFDADHDARRGDAARAALGRGRARAGRRRRSTSCARKRSAARRIARARVRRRHLWPRRTSCAAGARHRAVGRRR